MKNTTFGVIRCGHMVRSEDKSVNTDSKHHHHRLPKALLPNIYIFICLPPPHLPLKRVGGNRFMPWKWSKLTEVVYSIWVFGFVAKSSDSEESKRKKIMKGNDFFFLLIFLYLDVIKKTNKKKWRKDENVKRFFL